MRSFSRRDAIKLCAFGAVLLGGGATAAFALPDQRRLRPPGALGDEVGFLSLCTKCQKCLAVCETGVIVALSMAESVAGMATPVLDFDRSWCNFCGKCYEVCPTGALAAPEEGQRRVMGVARVLKDHCVAWNWTGCAVCVDVCPEGAVALDEQGRPFVKPDLCTGCGICQMKCPNASYRSFDKEFASVRGIVVEPMEEK